MLCCWNGLGCGCWWENVLVFSWGLCWCWFGGRCWWMRWSFLVCCSVWWGWIIWVVGSFRSCWRDVLLLVLVWYGWSWVGVCRELVFLLVLISVVVGCCGGVRSWCGFCRLIVVLYSFGVLCVGLVSFGCVICGVMLCRFLKWFWVVFCRLVLGGWFLVVGGCCGFVICICIVCFCWGVGWIVFRCWMDSVVVLGDDVCFSCWNCWLLRCVWCLVFRLWSVCFLCFCDGLVVCLGRRLVGGGCFWWIGRGWVCWVMVWRYRGFCFFVCCLVSVCVGGSVVVGVLGGVGISCCWGCFVLVWWVLCCFCWVVWCVVCWVGRCVVCCFCCWGCVVGWGRWMDCFVGCVVVCLVLVVSVCVWILVCLLVFVF